MTIGQEVDAFVAATGDSISVQIGRHHVDVRPCGDAVTWNVYEYSKGRHVDRGLVKPELDLDQKLIDLVHVAKREVIAAIIKAGGIPSADREDVAGTYQMLQVVTSR